MVLRISGKNMDIGEALRSQVETRVASAMSKYLDGASYQGHVTVCKDGTGFRTDCILHLSSGVTIEAHGNAHDAYASFAETADRIEKRLRRYKTRLRGHANGAVRKPDAIEVPYYVLESPGDEAEEEIAVDEFHPVVVAEQTTQLRRLSVSEAVVELDLTGSPVVVFRHAGNGRVNVVYRRRDGSIGWIDPQAAAGPQA